MSHKTASSPPRKIVFDVGARLEAMDFTQNWYSAKICRVDEKEQKALIHFEGWNHRYDEWIEFDSSRLRPHHRLHLFQEAKEERKDVCDYQDWNIGDRVLAKWLDCKYYPAKVIKCNPEGTCEVLFYDGVKKTVQRINMKPDNKKTILMPAIKQLDAGDRQKRRVEMASARAARARKRSKEEAFLLQEAGGKKKERVKKPHSQSHSIDDSGATSEASSVSSPAEVPSQEEVFHKLEQINITSEEKIMDFQEPVPDVEVLLEKEKQVSAEELKPLVFVKYKTEEECLPAPVEEATQLTEVREKTPASVGSITPDGKENYKQEKVSPREHDAQTALCVISKSEQLTDLTSTATGSCVEPSTYSASVTETDEVLDVVDDRSCSPDAEKVQGTTPDASDSAGPNNAEMSSGAEREKSENTAADVKNETNKCEQLNVSNASEPSHDKAPDDSISLEKPKALPSDNDSVHGNPVLLLTTAIIKKPDHKSTSEVPLKSPALKLKTSATRGGKTASKKRAPRGGRSTLNPRGYGYSMAFLPQQTSTESKTESTETSSAEKTASTAECTVTSAITTAGAASGTKTTPVKSQAYQAKKLRLDQITGKLSAQRQCEAKASVQSPSAFQPTGQSPPPSHLPPSPASLPPAQTPSPSAVTTPYPMESYPPPLLYAPPPLAPPCCANPHHQHQSIVYPPPGPPPRGSIPHGMHLPVRHVLPRQEYHPQSSGYMVYPPAQGAPYPRPCMGNCCQPLYHSLPHDSTPPPSSHDSALVRLMQSEQRMLHPATSVPHFRDMSPTGPWMTGPRHSQGPSSHYMPGPHTHEDLWRPTSEAPPSPSISPVTPTECLLARQQSKRSRKSERPLPTSTKSLPTTPTSTPTDSDPKQPSVTGDGNKNEPDKSTQTKERIDLGSCESEAKALPGSSSGECRHAAVEAGITPPASKATPVTQDTVTASPAGLNSLRVGAVPPSVPTSGVFTPSTASSFTGALHVNRPRKGKEGAGFAPKELVIEIDHNKYKCKVQGCDKSFRKESGLEYHMKYYHSEKNVKRKRASASGRLDSGSDISPEYSGPRTTKRRCHRYSAPGHLSNDPSPLVSPMSATESELGTSYIEGPEQEIEPGTESEGLELGTVESVEVEEEDERDTDVIRCICNEIEEGGFMIQCEQCLTWQHSDCLGLNEETVPPNYLCHVCSSPKGLRLNAKYRNDYDWFRQGTLSSFPFLPREESEYEVELTCATHDLVSDVYNVNTVLRSLRVKLELLRDPSNPQVDMWKQPEAIAAEEAEDLVKPGQDVVNGHHQTQLLITMKAEPRVNGLQTPQPLSDTLTRIPHMTNSSSSAGANVCGAKQAEGEGEGEERKPLHTNVSGGSIVDLGVVKKEGPPVSPLPALVPANRGGQGEQVDPIKRGDVLTSRDSNEGKRSFVQQDSSTGSHVVDRTTSSLSKPEEHVDALGAEKKTCVQPDSVSIGPARTDSVSTGPARTDSVSTGPARTDSVSIGPARTDSVSTGPARTDSVSTGPARTDAVSTGPARTDSECAKHVVKEEAVQGSVDKRTGKEPLSAVENLLDDITSLQDEMDTRMTQIDKQLSVLEDAYSTPPPSFRKPDLRKLVKDLNRVRRMLHHVR